MAENKTIFLDRDGTIIVEEHYLSDPEKVRLLPGAAQGLRALCERGWQLVVVTNQSAVGRGLIDMQTLGSIHDRMLGLLAEQGVSVEQIYVCPHVPDQGCGCRKPETGLLTQASAAHDIKLAGTYVIGDKPCDIALGNRVGAFSILVRTGYGEAYDSKETPDWVVDDLAEASELIRGRADG